MTLCDRLAAYFKARPGEWVDGMSLARVAGHYAWRSRVSDLRRAPYGLVIENRQRRVHRVIVMNGEDCPAGSYMVSEYRYMPGLTPDRGADAPDSVADVVGR